MNSDLRAAIIVNPDLPIGLVANTAGAIAIGMGAKMPDLGADALTDQGDRTIDASSQLPLPILQADPEKLNALLIKALEQKGENTVVPFPAFARSLHSYDDYKKIFPERDLSREVIDGIGLIGPAKWVRSLTGSFKLLR